MDVSARLPLGLNQPNEQYSRQFNTLSVFLS